MAPADYPVEKEYIDRSVQTEDSTFDIASCLQLDAMEHEQANALEEDVSSVLSKLKNLGISDEDQGRKEQLSVETSNRILKRLPHRKPSGPSQTLKSISTRVVSLPETVPEYSEMKVLRKSVKMRVVSMPSKSQQRPSGFCDGSPSSDTSLGHILAENEAPVRIRVCSNATDALHTPSPPSSPESVVIIGSKSQISERFLQGNVCAEESSPSIATDDDDWVNWARSPPRPIPALHGPLSLPYARCPSGAEGTIIDEQDNLPRIIWGLEGDDSSRLRQEASHTASNMSNSPEVAQISRKPINRVAQASLPPRFSQLPELAAQSTTSVLQPIIPKEPRQPPSASTDTAAQSIEYTLPTHGPIDLSQLARPRSALGSAVLPSEGGYLSNRTRGPIDIDMRLNARQGDLKYGWESGLIPSTSTRSSLASSNLSSHGDFSDYIGTSSSSLSLSSLSSSRSPIVLDIPSQVTQLSRAFLNQHSPLSSQSTPLHTPLTSHPPLQRMSALEIAQKYRQQQMLQKQQQSMLPTPPSSSSPLWSSGFSPYQEFLLSPEALATAPWSQVIGHPVQANAPRNQLQTRQDLTLPAVTHHVAMNSAGHQTGLEYAHIRPSAPQASPARLPNQTSNNHDLAFSANAIDLSLLNSGGHVVPSQRQDGPMRNDAHAVSQVQRSPMAPRPPPNTPLQPTGMRPQQLNHSLDHSPGKVNQVNPAVTTNLPPGQGSRSLAQQHPRSVPLHRLIQRRLSSVPEEECPFFDSRSDSLEVSGGERQRRASMEASMPPYKQQEAVYTARPKETLSFLPSISNYVLPPTAQASSRSSYRPPSGTLPAPSTPQVQHKPAVARPAPNNQPRGREGQDGSRAAKGRPRGRSGRRGRVSAAPNGPERVDGGLTVRS